MGFKLCKFKNIPPRVTEYNGRLRELNACCEDPCGNDVSREDSPVQAEAEKLPQKDHNDQIAGQDAC